MTLDISVNGTNGGTVRLTLAEETMVSDVVDFFEALGITGWELDYRNRKKPAMKYDGEHGVVVFSAQKRQDYGLFAAVAINTLWS